MRSTIRRVIHSLVLSLALSLASLDRHLGISTRVSHVCRGLPAVAEAKFKVVLSMWRTYEPAGDTRAASNLMKSSNHFRLADLLQSRRLSEPMVPV